MSESRTAAVRRVEFAVDWPPGHVACYLIEADELLLVDAGTPDGLTPGTVEHETLRDGVGSAGHDLADVDHLLVTHPHVDHVGQVPTVLEAADPTLYAPAGLRERFARDADAMAERVRANARAVGIEGEQLDSAVDSAVESLERDRSLCSPDDIDVWVEPGEFGVGSLDGRAIHTPGHQADHLAYEFEIDGERLLFSGDLAIEPFRAVLLHDGLDDGHPDAVSGYEAALDRLSDLDVDRVFPGHGPVHDRLAETIERDRGSLHRRVDRVADLVADGTGTVAAVAAALSGDRDPRYVLAETMSVLAHLANEGCIERYEADGVRRYR
jgi:glyoxylase-like metal-dependent hydrolase (beta-lactamase superfamily II)